MIKKLQNLSLGWKFVLIQIVCISVTVTTVSMTATFVYNRYVNESILRDRGYEAAYAANQALLKISQVQAQSQWRAASSTVKNILHTGNHYIRLFNPLEGDLSQEQCQQIIQNYGH